MTPTVPPSRRGRRRVLQALAGVPLLGLATPAVRAQFGPAPGRAGARVDLATQAEQAYWDGAHIMAESLRRHQQFPFVYEEQTMVLVDAERQRSVRRCRRYTRYESDGRVQFLLVFDEPEEIRGVALLATRSAAGETSNGIYLPAFGAELKRAAGDGLGGHFLGTDFAVEDLTPEQPERFGYQRQRDRLAEQTEYFVVDAHPRDPAGSAVGGHGLRRHLLRKDNLMIVQTDVRDSTLRLIKRITHHDLERVDGDSWRANMIIAHDRRESHRTLLKVDRRVYSEDYVPAQVFEPAYLLANRHVVAPALGTAQDTPSAAERELLDRG